MPPERPDLPASPDVESVCAEARRLREAIDGEVESLRSARRELAEATRILELTSLDANRRHMADRKGDATRAWREAMAAAVDDAGRRDATARWMRRISDLNRRAQSAVRRLPELTHGLAVRESQVADAELAAAAARIRAETAEAACAEARVRRAARAVGRGAVDDHGGPPIAASDAVGGDGGIEAPVGVARAAEEPLAGGVPASIVADSPTVRALLAGDPGVHQTLAGELAEMSGTLPARYLLLLDSLVEELMAAAIDAGELAFDRDHPLWSQFSSDQARLITLGLRDLGFRLDVHEGWYGGRAPTANDLAAALGFVGYDLRALHGIPSAAELRALPESVTVAAHDHLRRTAPDLTLAQMTGALGARAGGLGELWDEWGTIRPLLEGTLADGS